jgi:RNA polymerase-binding transcription factor DksA
MEKKEIDRYRSQLQELTERMRGDATAVTEQIRQGSGGQSGGGLSNAPMHLGDMGTDEYLQDLNTTLLEHEEYLSSEVREAFNRIDDGTFGVCESCSKPIAKERLDALPYARRCTHCAEAADMASPSNLNTANINSGRPRRPQDTLAPQGEMDESGRRRSRRDNVESDAQSSLPAGDIHAAGTPGGGTSIGGLAGSNAGHGGPDVADLQDAMGSGDADAREAQADSDRTPKAGRAGGAVGGTPANKRNRTGQTPR